jgi:hypothetical protein
LTIIVALPVATSNGLKNSAKFALGDFVNRVFLVSFMFQGPDQPPVSGWPNGFAFVRSFLAPAWTIGNFNFQSTSFYADKISRWI